MRTHHGIRLWTVKQAPFLQGDDGLPTWNFDPSDITFTPKMDKRTAPGPFTAAPIIQQKRLGDNDTGDKIIAVAGDVISGAFYENIDAYQGSISSFWTPEFIPSLGTLGYVWWGSSWYSLRFRSDFSKFVIQIGGKSYYSNELVPVAGQTYHIVLRWDYDNTLDGTNYACLSIDDVHDFGITAAPDSTNISTHRIGHEDDYRCANAIIEGFTIYRRPLFDGTYGTDVGNGDEINLIYAAGAGKDPCLVTGSWDVCFCLPTNCTTGEIVTGTGEAWSHPHSSNLLGAGGFMIDGTYTNDGWADEGTPTAVAALATAEKIYPGGYKVTSDAANEGIYKDYTCSAGDDFVIRAIAHSDGTSIPKAILYDQTNTAEIGSLTGSNASTLTAPDVFIFTGEAPAGCTTLRVKLINTDATASDITYWHQCELLVNGATNPSAEGGSGDPWMPTGWWHISFEAGDTERETTIVHSGADSIQLNAGASTWEMYRWGPVGVVGAFHAIGAWLYGDGTNGPRLRCNTNSHACPHSEDIVLNIRQTAASWVHVPAVMRRKGTGGGEYSIGGDDAGPLYADDVYAVFLDDVSLTVTPDNEAGSTEDSGIRVDGLDSCTVDITGELGATSGKVRFNWTPRHGEGDFEKFGISNPYIIQVRYGNDDEFIFWRSTNTQLDFNFDVGGVTDTDNWSPSGEIVAGTKYLIEIEYNSTQCTVSVDGTVKMTVTPAGGIDFGANIPTTVYFHHRNNISQADAVFSAP
ncbi:hypothetical protein ACFLV7_15340 [Chloroflexota bacterium]